MERTNVISTEEYIEMIKPIDSIHALKLEEGMKTFHIIDAFDKEPKE